MPKSITYTDEEILLALIWIMPKKMTKGQIGRLLGIKSAGQKHWRERLEKLGKKNLLSIEALDGGDLFFGSPILKYYLTDVNIEKIWRHYFINYDERHNALNYPFLTPFSIGIWTVTSSSDFSKLVGSRFNYHFLCAQSESNPISPAERIKSVSKEKTWKILDAVLSITWKIETYKRKPVLMAALTHEQKNIYGTIMSLYEKQIKEHPADYKKFTALFDKSFEHYI